ncbi:MAG: hypothetical protein RIB98_10880 [Acidimicrobiales bacterium]
MSGRIEALPWDSDFFDLSIGRVVLDGATADDLAAFDAEARDRDFDCVYGALDTGQDDDNVAIRVQLHNFLLVDQSVQMMRPDVPYVPLPSDSVAREATEDDIEAIMEIVPIIAPWSRFGADDRFGLEAGVRMWRAQVERGIRDETRLVTVTEDDSGLTGFATQACPGELGVPGYESTTVTKPGAGVADALMAYFFDWAPGGTATSAGWMAVRNIAILRHLHRHGYVISSSRGAFHWWKDGASYG